jgi:hypothetical protein
LGLFEENEKMNQMNQKKVSLIKGLGLSEGKGSPFHGTLNDGNKEILVEAFASNTAIEHHLLEPP